MNAILQKAAAQNCRIWIDVEQQFPQGSIDRWTIDLMRKYNRNDKAVLYNTLQAYLKASRDKLEHQLRLAHDEGWTLAIKLVRGAYIDNDIRERIHDTKAQTDMSYDSIVRNLLSDEVQEISEFPKMQLFLADHNPASVSKTSNLIHELQAQDKLKTLSDFDQLQRMTNQLGCELLQREEDTTRAFEPDARPIVIPRVYKCLTWKSIQKFENAFAVTHKHNCSVPELGCYVPGITFFNPETDKLDPVSQKKSYSYLASTELKGLVVLGTNAETFLLNREERKSLLEIARQAVSAAYPIIADVEEHSTSQTLEYISDAHDASANFALLLSCVYFEKQTTSSVVKRFYAEVAEKSPLPIIIYNFPAVCNGLDMKSNIIMKIVKQHNNVVEIKLTCGSMTKIVRLAAVFPPSRFAVFEKQADFLLDDLAAGKDKEALALQRVLSLAEALTKDGIASTKYAATVMTAPRAKIAEAESLLWSRRPYEKPEVEVKARILKTISPLSSLEDAQTRLVESSKL